MKLGCVFYRLVISSPQIIGAYFLRNNCGNHPVSISKISLTDFHNQRCSKHQHSRFLLPKGKSITKYQSPTQRSVDTRVRGLSVSCPCPRCEKFSCPRPCPRFHKMPLLVFMSKLDGLKLDVPQSQRSIQKSTVLSQTGRSFEAG